MVTAARLAAEWMRRHESEALNYDGALREEVGWMRAQWRLRADIH